MRDELLTRAELESLLAADSADGIPAEEEAAGDGIAATRRSAAGNTGARPLAREPAATDAPRMRRLAQHHLAALGSLHQEASRALAEALGRLLRGAVVAGAVRVDQPTAGEFLESLDTPACGYHLRVTPLAATWTLSLSASLALAIIDRLLGGGKETSAVAPRPLTEIERRLMTRVSGPLVSWLEASWKPLSPIRVSAEEPKNALAADSLGPTHRAVVRIRLPLTLGNTAGNLVLGVPCASIASLRGQLMSAEAVDGWSTPPASAAGTNPVESPTELLAVLTDSHLPAADLDGLAVGDIIATDHPVHQPLTLTLQGRPRFLGSLGAHGGSKAVRIETEVADSPE